MRMNHIVVCGLSNSAVFAHYLKKARFWKNVIERKTFDSFSLQLWYEKFLILRI